MARGQVIVIKLPMHSDRSRSRAMRIAAEADGTVISIRIQGADRDHLVVTGEGIDSVNLTRSLRKKFQEATIVSIRAITSSPERISGSYRNDYGTYGSIEYRQDRHQWQPPAPSYYTYNYPSEYREAYGSSPSDCTVM